MALDDAIQNLQERDSRAWDVGLSTLERSIIIDALYQSIDNAYRTYGRRVNEKRIGATEALIVKLLGREAAQ
jgi:choline kinase